MSDAKRTHEVMVRLNDDELARLDELRPSVTARAVYLRTSYASHQPTGT